MLGGAFSPCPHQPPAHCRRQRACGSARLHHRLATTTSQQQACHHGQVPHAYASAMQGQAPCKAHAWASTMQGQGPCRAHAWAAAGPRPARSRLVAHAAQQSALDLDEQEEWVQEMPYHQFKILYRDDDVIAIDKPRGFYVHPPEDGRPCPVEENGLWLLKRQLGGQWLWPVHRLDRATSGVVLYCLTQDAASQFGRSMREREVKKTYHALVRGYAKTYGRIDDDIGSQPSTTLYQTMARCQIPLKVGKWPSARYSLLRLEPLTGRFHQIRRHLNYASHPIVGDSDHGDRYHNRAFLNDLQLGGMYLRATTLEFTHPATGEPLCISVDSWEERWHAAFHMMGMCPALPPNNPGPAPWAIQRETDHGVLEEQIELSQQPLSTVLRLRQGTNGLQLGHGGGGWPTSILLGTSGRATGQVQSVGVQGQAVGSTAVQGETVVGSAVQGQVAALGPQQARAALLMPLSERLPRQSAAPLPPPPPSQSVGDSNGQAVSTL